MTRKGSYIQHISICMMQPSDKLLYIVSHWGVILHTNIVIWGSKLEHFIKVEFFGLSCVHPIHYLGESTGFHCMRANADGVSNNYHLFYFL